MVSVLLHAIKLPAPVEGLTKTVAGLPEDTVCRSSGGEVLEFWSPGEQCYCVACHDNYREKIGSLDGLRNFGLMTIMSLCETCGNKRCPKATFHEHECTGSNKPNQKGSIYNQEKAPKL